MLSARRIVYGKAWQILSVLMLIYHKAKRPHLDVLRSCLFEASFEMCSLFCNGGDTKTS